ncbi:SprT family zinc-dependent metalloprotease [uncultured Clostridium sp.]|jgi:hypothetical protein|uniref:M48 family metallopeptidase n=1 Tax=uncultured Clostridium sp. TaxID=59620 RepID=UPI002626A2B0|nr:SprT family zinc-dependent metalloprotease [uncultured Clostridium sp.]
MIKKLIEQGIEIEVIKLEKKSVSIEVDNKGKTIIRMPKKISKENIDKILSKRFEWIKENVEQIKKKNNFVITRSFEEGEKFLYLGELYILVFAKEEKIDIEKKIIYAKKENTKKSLEKLYKILARDYIIGRVDYFSSNFREEAKIIKIKNQKRRWGSCSFDNNLNFNFKIIMARKEIVDYLVIHEMSHMPHKNHSSDFWNQVKKIIPDYISLRRELKEIAFKLDL